MRIAFVHPPFETVPTFSERRAAASLVVWTHEMAKRLAEQGHTVAIFSRGDADHCADVHDQGVGFHYTSAAAHKLERRFVNGLTNLEYLANYPRRKRPILATRWFYPLYIRSIAQALGQGQWDIIHITNMPPFAPVLRAHNPDARIILHMHALWLSEWDPALVRGYLEAADLVITVSEFLTNAFKASFPGFASRCQTLYNGVNIERFLNAGHAPTPPDAPQILFVGRVSPEKGVHVLIDAFTQVAARCPKASLHIVGETNAIGYQYIIPMADDPLVRDLRRFYHPITKRERYLRALHASIPASLRGQVHFHGRVPQVQLKQYFSTATVSVFPSVWNEPFGIALVEGMASGVPVVCTRGGAVGELAAHGVNCLMVERNDPQEMAQAILRLIEDPCLRERLGGAAQTHVKRLLSWDHAGNDLMHIYQQILQPEAPDSLQVAQAR